MQAYEGRDQLPRHDCAHQSRRNPKDNALPEANGQECVLATLLVPTGKPHIEHPIRAVSASEKDLLRSSGCNTIDQRLGTEIPQTRLPESQQETTEEQVQQGHEIQLADRQRENVNQPYSVHDNVQRTTSPDQEDH